MRTISREKIKRMVGSDFGNGGAGGGGGADLSGYATQGWVDENYLSIEFFGSLFKAYAPGENTGDPDVEVEPNGGDVTTITNIKAMFGFWTEQYISALGQGTGGSGGALALADLVDVLLSSPTNGQFLKYNGTKWINADIPQSVNNLNDLGDVQISSPTADQILKFNGTKWVNGAAPQSITLSDVWNALAGNTNQQINASHLSTIFNAISLSSSWATNFSITIGGITKTLLSISADQAGELRYTKELWGQNFNGTQNVSGDMSGVGNITMNGENRINPNGNHLYIGNSNNSKWVYMADMCSQNDSDYWKIYADGNATFANVLSNGYVTALSDIRLKTVLGRFMLSADAIAQASIIQFEWKDGHDERKHVGGIAQEWQDILPDAVVEDSDGRLSMDYGAISYVSVVSLAKKVVSQQKEIDALKAENASLEKRLARLERMFALTGEEE